MSNFSIAYLIELKDRYTKVAQKVAQANQMIKESVANVEKKLGNFSDCLSSTKDKFKALEDRGKESFIGISLPIGGAIAGIIKMGASLEDTRMVFTTMLGDAQKADKMVADVMQMAAKTPFETPELLDATQMMLNFGIAQKDVMKNLQMLGDISGGNKMRFQGLALAFSQMSALGRLTGGDFRQMVDKGFNPLKIISEKTGKSMAELQELMSKGAISAEMVVKAMDIATSKGGKYYNLMAKQATTLNGLMSTLSDNVGLAASKIGEKMLPYIKPIVQVLINMTNGLENLNPQMTMIVISLAGIVAIIPAVILGIGVMGRGFIAFMETMTMAGQGIMGFIGWLTKLNLITKITTAVQAVLNATLWMNPITWIVAGIIALVAVLVIAYQKCEWFRNAVQALWIGLQVLWTYIQIFALTLWQKLQPAIQAVGNIFAVVWGKVVQFGQAIGNLFVKISSILAPVINFGKFVFMWLTPLGLVINAVVTLVKNFDKVANAIAKAKNAMQGFKADADVKLAEKQKEISATQASGNSTTDVNVNLRAEKGTQVTKTKVKSSGNNKPNVGVNQAGKGR